MRFPHRAFGRLTGQATFAFRTGFRGDPLGDQGGLARGDFLLPTFVFDLAGRFRFPVTALDLPLLAAFFLARFFVPAALGGRLLALLGRVQALLRLSTLFRGDRPDRAAVQIVAAIPSAVDERQEVAIALGVVGQHPAQQVHIDLGQPLAKCILDAEGQRLDRVVVRRERLGKAFPQQSVDRLDRALIGGAHRQISRNSRSCPSGHGLRGSRQAVPGLRDHGGPGVLRGVMNPLINLG